MTERKPSDDLKEGLGLLFRAARGMAKDVTPEKAEKLMHDGGIELVRVLNTVGRAIGTELEKSFGDKPAEDAKAQHDAEKAAEAQKPPSTPPPAPPPADPKP